MFRPFFWPTAGTYKDETRCGNGFHRAAEKIRNHVVLVLALVSVEHFSIQQDLRLSLPLE